MSSELKISVGQHSDKGRKEINQDFHGICIPAETQLRSKGIAIALADGISSSDVSQIASASAVKAFLEDYYCTSEAWSVKTSAQRVLTATNSWLHSQTQRSEHRYEKDKGYVCTLSALVIKSTTAHIFHVGDSRIYRLRGKKLEQLTHDHRIYISGEQSYLGRALGINPQVEIDYQSDQIEKGDIFLLATDGVYEHVDAAAIIEAIESDPDHLDEVTRRIVAAAYENGSADNLTLQIVRIDELPNAEVGEIHQQFAKLPLPPLLDARAVFDGYRIVREVHGSSRSHIYLAVDIETDATVILKTPSIDLGGNPDYLERFLMEEWVARRINSAHVLKPCSLTRQRNFLYVVTEYIEGQTLTQWMIDNPRPDLEAVRDIVEQIAKGLRAFHRLEMLHQDLRPENIMIDATGTVKIIDFGSTRVTGVIESAPAADRGDILGTVQFTAPEYFLGDNGTSRSDLFSLGVIAYQMLCGKLPYGAEVARARTKAAQKKLRYRPVLDDDREIPVWVDGALRKAVHPDPYKRYAELSEFIFDLRHPNVDLMDRSRPPLIEQHPEAFWKGVSLVLAIIIVLIGLHSAVR
ncbi:bifunctional protein-serine/threonine kinase/phosphatase [Uliginosibacterium sp. H3]|uniref:Bifunctional protein-serine/threonine kinase/phosphatase n=1 Tax=Uliginosibacterium silvisoli TaxID=3114758 RepID=A0ABU6K3C0_9RHOO|nr:bifunctional protein-serine/threonine kinase/phosphatase [Uliginosibacterium sp. H3]